MTDQLVLLPTAKDESKSFRPIHYLGNKWRVREAIKATIADISPTGTACDLFAGSGVVAAALATERQVIAADIQEYSRTIVSALLEPARLPRELLWRWSKDVRANERRLRTRAFADLVEYERVSIREALEGKPNRLCEIVESGSIAGYERGSDQAPPRLASLLDEASASLPSGSESALSRYYGGVYFSYEQALQLDALSVAARSIPGPFRDTVVASALSTATDIVSSVGNHFAQPPRPRSTDGSMKRGVIERISGRRLGDAREIFDSWLARYMALPSPKFNHVVVRADFRQVLADPPREFAIIYADPPYTRDHYSRFYHVLETMALGDDPGVSQSYGPLVSRGLYRLDRHQSPFSIASQVVDAFRDLIRGAFELGIPLVLSYSPYDAGSPARPKARLLTIDQLKQLLGERYSQVEVRSPGPVAHSKLNRRDLNIERNRDAELLLTALP